jgi:hypothetical protein
LVKLLLEDPMDASVGNPPLLLPPPTPFTCFDIVGSDEGEKLGNAEGLTVEDSVGTDDIEG